MTFTFDELKLARERGYSDDEIWNTLSSEDKEIGLAKERGYSLEEVASITSGQPVPEGFAARPVEPEPERRAGGGVAGGAADIGVSFMKGLGTGTRMISDVFGANNPVSQAIAGYEDYFDDLLSAESKQDSQKISSILKDAEGKGILPQIMAGLEAFTVAPAEMTASTMGIMLPNLAGGVYAKAAQLTKAGVIGLQMGIGAAQGAGSIKGQIYTAVQEELRQQGLPEDKIDDIATEAQAYNGKNLDQILIGAGLGAAASSTGAEKIMTRLITGAGKEASEDIIKAVIKGGFSEAPIEALQGGQEKIAENVALQRIGVDVPTMQGVIPAATMEATAGLVIGGGFGGVEALTSPEQKEEKKIDKQSNQVANELLAENTPATQSVVKELARRENAVANLQEAYDALEPTSQEAQKLKLELSEAQRNLSAFKGVANKAGLSETITEAEKQQIELAKAITTPEVVAPTEPAAPTTPAIAAQEGAKEMNLQEISESAIAAFPDMMEADGGLLPLTRFTPDEQASLRKAGIVETATTSKGETYEGVNSEYLWQRRNQLQQERAAKLKQAPTAEATVAPAPVSETITPAVEAAPVTPAPAEAPAITPAPVAETPAAIPVEKKFNSLRKSIGAINPLVGDMFGDKVAFTTAKDDDPNKAEVVVTKDIDDPNTVILENIFVPEGGRGRGLGRSAMEKFLAEVDRLGMDVKLEVDPETSVNQRQRGKSAIPMNEDQLRNWYSKFGFQFKYLGSGIGYTTRGFRPSKETLVEQYKQTLPPIPVGTKLNPNNLFASPSDLLGAFEQGNEQLNKARTKGFYGGPNFNEGEIYYVSGGDIFTLENGELKRHRGVAEENGIVVEQEEVLTTEEKIPRFAPTPAVSETITPAAPTGISVGNRIKLGKSPQTYTVEQVIPQSETERGLGEQFYSVKNERTGEVQTVEAKDLKPVLARVRRGEKGGVLFLTREDFIQAGQNIYEAGMEFATWARQMVQRFGDAVRQFLGDIWQAVSGIPAKVNELAGFLPGKGEAGAVAFGRGEEPPKPPKKPSEPAAEAKPTEEATGRREKIMGEEVGPIIKTQDGIIAKTKEKLKTLFDPEKVNETNTSTAYRAIGILSGKNRDAAREYAESINALTAEGLGEDADAATEISMGAALFVNNLFEYAVKLAANGDRKMLGLMVANINKLPTGQMGASDAGRTLRARVELKARFLLMAQAEQDAFTNYVAEYLFGPNPTPAQIKSIKDAYSATQKVSQPTAEELTEEIAGVGEKTGTDLVKKINDDFTSAAEKDAEARDQELNELSKEYNQVQNRAENEIEKLATIQSDTPSFVQRKKNEIRAIVSSDLKQRPDMGRKAPWKSLLVARLKNAGVSEANAETLADLVWRQHEINSLSRELESINKAIEKGPISEIINQIKDTPIEQQQDPKWRYQVMRDYLRRAGLSMAQAERIAKLMDISLQKRFTEAKEQAFTDAIQRSAPWKNGEIRSKRAFDQMIKAIRAGALDPSRNFISDIAAMNGWTGFTDDQYAKLLKLDAILANPKSSDADKAEAHKEVQNIISKAKLPIRARDILGQFYDAQALSGIPTITVNMVSPIGMAAKNALVQAASGVATFRPEQVDAAFKTLIDSIKSWVKTVAYSFKNNVTVYSNVEYLVNDEGLLKLYNRGKDQFKNGKTPRDRADGVKNMMIGMWDYVRRILNALDYGAIASLQNQNVPKYALAAMQAKGMSSKDGAKMLNAMFEAKRNFYENQIAIGTDKNKASVLADEFFVSSWRQALTDAKLPAQEVMDAAINDAMSAVGRTRASLDGFRDENTKLQDSGVTSFPALWLLQTMANAANKSDSQIIKIFSRVIYGFAVVPARVFRETAWFSPYGYVRFAYDAIAKKKGLNSPYAQSLGSDLQYRQRLTEATASTLVLLGLASALASSTDDEDDKRPFKIVVTGNGPNRADDPQYYDSWIKNNTPNTVTLKFGKVRIPINTMRGFEAFAWPAMMLGAVDDWKIRRKLQRKEKNPTELGDAAVVAGNLFSAALKRGPYAFAAKPLFEAYGDRTVESLFKSIAFPAKTLIPVIGSSILRNASDFINDPIDRRTIDGALWSNVPFIGPAVAPKALNAFGEPAMAGEAADKLFKLGVPIVFNIPNDRESVNLHELVLKKGGGPSIPTRTELARRLDRDPTNKEFQLFVKEYGSEISRVMKSRYKSLEAKKPEDYDAEVKKIGDKARDRAERIVKQKAKQP